MTFEEWFAQQDFNVRYGNAVEELQKEYEARLKKAWQAGYEHGKADTHKDVVTNITHTFFDPTV